jgi:hypothetical protein
MMLSLMENIEERKVRFVYYSKYSELGSDFYTATDNWGTPAEFNEANVALRTTVKEEALPKSVDTFIDLVLTQQLSKFRDILGKLICCQSLKCLRKDTQYRESISRSICS